MTTFRNPFRITTLLTLLLFSFSTISPIASAATNLTCYKGTLVKVVTTKTCPTGYSKTKPATKVAVYYPKDAVLKKSFIDSRNSKKIPDAVIEFWKNLNEISEYVYLTNQTEMSNQAFNNNAWFLVISKGYQPQAAPNLSNSEQSGLWYRSDNSPVFVTPLSAPCKTPGSSIRYIDFRYTCLDTLIYGPAQDIAKLTPTEVEALNSISGDGYDPNLPATPGRRCSVKNKIETLYGVQLTCIFTYGTLIPQSTDAVTLVNSSDKTEYCLLNTRLIVTTPNAPKYIMLSLITSTCSAYYKTHTLKPLN
jgi:hypothetical protein